MRVFFLFTLFLILITIFCRNKESVNEEIPLRSSPPFVVIHQETLYVEIRDTEKEREIGLMFTDKLIENCGMLFIFENERQHSFWMKNTKIPLSIAFINSKRIIVDIKDMEPMTENIHISRFSSLYALEVNKGWFNKHNVVIGDTIYFHF